MGDTPQIDRRSGHFGNWRPWPKDLGKRLALAVARDPGNVARPAAAMVWREMGAIVDSFARMSRPPLEIGRTGDPKMVVLIPGFLTHPVKMRYFARQVERAGHKVKRWGLGFNFGATAENFEQVAERVCAVSRRYDCKVVLVGWSLGGIFAREVAKRHPDLVEKVITMGTPFSGSPYTNNAWRVYHLVAGHAVDEPPIETDSIINVWAHIKFAGLSSILPEYFNELLAPDTAIRSIPLEHSGPAHRVGLITLERDPLSPLVSALFDTCRDRRFFPLDIEATNR